MKYSHVIYPQMSANGKPSKSEGTMKIYGEIPYLDWDEWEWKNTENQLLRDFEKLERDHDVIHVRIHSPGGAIHFGMPLFNAMQRSEKEIHTYNDGIAYSLGAMLFLAGKKRHSAPNSILMLHNASSGFWGNAQAMQDHVDVLKKYDHALALSMSNQIGLSVEEFKATYLNYKDNFFNSDECKSIGFTHDVEGEKAVLPTNVKEMSEKEITNFYNDQGWNPRNIDFDTFKTEKENFPTSQNVLGMVEKTIKKLFPHFQSIPQNTLNHKNDSDKMDLGNLKFALDGDISNGLQLSKAQAENLKNLMDGFEGKVYNQSELDAAIQNASSSALTEKETEIENLKKELEEVRNQLSNSSTPPTVTTPNNPDVIDSPSNVKDLDPLTGEQMGDFPV